MVLSSAIASDSLTAQDLTASQGTASVAEILKFAAILVIDDEVGMRSFLQRFLEKECALLEIADSIETAEALRKRCHFDLLIVDIRLPGSSGIDWLRELRTQGINTDVIVMTAYADMDVAIAALRAGAADFILKPFRMEQMMTAVRRCLERRRMLRENILLKRQVKQIHGMDGIVGESQPIKETYQMIERVATAVSTVLIEGETGTGKELVAQAIHKLSNRRGAFVPLNCGSISPELLESELFGHIKGAFTGAQSSRDGLFLYAHEGTLFLDEIGELPMSMQAKLLRVLEERAIRPVGSDSEVRVDTRVIAATNSSLQEQVNAGRFREDLYYRLDVLTIKVPALRDRAEDIPMLAEHFAKTIAADLGVSPIPYTHQDMMQLQSYGWPGNVRELKNVIERSLLLGKLPNDCFRSQTHGEWSQSTMDISSTGLPLNWTLAEVEKHHSLQVLNSVEGNKSEAARRLKISRKTLERKLNTWNAMVGNKTAEV